jgi:hypothetical protein
MDVKLIVNRVRPDMIAKNDMMSVRDVQVRRVPASHETSIHTRVAPSYLIHCVTLCTAPDGPCATACAQDPLRLLFAQQ